VAAPLSRFTKQDTRFRLREHDKMREMASVTTTTSDHAGSRTRFSVNPLMAAFAGIIAADLASSFISWQIVQPGISLFGPTALTIVIMGFTALSSYFVLRKRQSRKAQRTLGSFVVVLCLLPPIWTYFGVLQVSIFLDSSATRTAQELIASKSTTCNIVPIGSVGRLRAPYEVCATDYPGYGYRVNFSTLDNIRGYAYIKGRSNVSWFPDQCAKHLSGNWWVFNISINAANGSCPMGLPVNGSG
jgi:hypothetical protein